MAHRYVEIVIGRLLTDEAFRAAFVRAPGPTLRAFVDEGHELTRVEIEALTAVGPEVWGQIANRIDPRLLKVSLG